MEDKAVEILSVDYSFKKLVYEWNLRGRIAVREEGRTEGVCFKMGGTSLAVQWLRLHTSNIGGVGSIPGQVTKIPCAAWCGQK